MSDLLKNIFIAVDRMDADGFASFLHQDCRFRFGNQADVFGRAAARDYVANFFTSINGLSHDIVESCNFKQALWCHGQVTYTRKDGTILTVPVSNFMRLHEDNTIDEYLIFVDTSELYK